MYFIDVGSARASIQGLTANELKSGDYFGKLFLESSGCLRCPGSNTFYDISALQEKSLSLQRAKASCARNPMKSTATRATQLCTRLTLRPQASCSLYSRFAELVFALHYFAYILLCSPEPYASAFCQGFPDSAAEQQRGQPRCPSLTKRYLGQGTYVYVCVCVCMYVCAYCPVGLPVKI
jgi:hypothetical protein